MINVTVKIDMSKFETFIRRAPALTVSEISKAIQKSLITVHNQALKEAPVGKMGGGNLRQKIQPPKMTSRLRGEIVSKAPYTIFVTEKTNPHIIRIKNKKVLANKRTGQFFGKEVHHPGTRANPFLMRAVKNSEAKTKQYFKVASLNIIKEIK